MLKTNKQDIINNFSKYLGRKPNEQEIAKYSALPPTTLESDLKAAYKKTTGNEYGKKTNQNNEVKIDAADSKWINDLYSKYFDRTATSAELANWAKQTPTALQDFLSAEQKKYNYTSSYFKDESNKRLDDAYKVIDDANLPPDLKSLWKTTVAAYPDGIEFDTNEILSTFEQVKKNTIDPYYKQLADIAINDIKTSTANLKENRGIENEIEDKTAQNNIENSQASLESSGMTFSGEGIKQLGDKSAFTEGAGGNVPSGGMFVEGNVNQANRIMKTSSLARYNQNLQSIGNTAEKYLGSGGVAGIVNGYNPLGGMTGTLETNKQSQLGTTLNQLISNYYNKQNLNKNINFSN